MNVSRAVGGVGLVLAGVLAGCGLVVGSGDYVIGDAGALGADANSSLDAGGGDDSEPAEAGGRGPDAAGSDASDGGEQVVEFEAGAGLEAGSTVACGPDGGLVLGAQATSADFQKLVDTCTLAVSCDALFFPVTISGCITNNYLQAIGSVACLSTIQDCDGFYGCQGERNAKPAECQGKGTSGYCSGNVAITCFGGAFVGSAQNCDKLGGTCMTHLDADGDMVADCALVPAPVPACRASSDTANQCSGNKVYSCVNSGAYGEDCSAINATCMDEGSGALCYFNAPSCSGSGASKCSEGVLQTCTSDTSQEFDYQCSRAGLSCLDDSSDVACVAPGCAPPSTSTCTEGCGADGTTAEVCVGGAPFPIDCTKYGYTKCTYDDVEDYAFCTF